MKHFIGQQVRVGGIKGCIMTIVSIDGDDMKLVSPGCTYYYHKGDCSLIPVKEVRYEQLSLF